jgi:type II secretory pathway pseudopilin PulG
MSGTSSPAPKSTAYSFLEVLVSLVILLGGILAILAYFPNALRANDRAVVLSEAALLAQRKAEEIRRDGDRGRLLIRQIQTLTIPTSPIVFPENSTLAYRFCGVSLFHPTDDRGDPRDRHGVARIIVQYSQGYRPDGRILYELRFDE